MKAGQTNGCSLIVFHGINLILNASIESLCSVGARFNNTYLSFITSSKNFKAIGDSSFINFSACFGVYTIFLSISLPIMNGVNILTAIYIGNQHSSNLRFGPTVIIDLPE